MLSDEPAITIEHLSSALRTEYVYKSITNKVFKVGILISGAGSDDSRFVSLTFVGTNMKALIDHCRNRSTICQIVVVISNIASAHGLTIARDYGIDTMSIRCKGDTNDERELYEKLIDAELEKHGVELVCLAGFMRRLSPWFVMRWNGRLLNTHPSLLPTFKGHDAVKQAIDSGALITGCTVHFVNVCF